MLDMWHAWKGSYGDFWWGKRSDGDHLENLDVDDSIILQWILMKLGGSEDWIDMILGK